MSELVVHEMLDLLGEGVVVGNHSAWVPSLGAKIPFQYDGDVVKYRHPREAHYPVEIVAEEVALMRALAERRWAPPVGRVVYFKTVVSEHPGYWWSDPLGGYGYEVADARAIAPGAFSLEEFRRSGLAVGSEGAWADIAVPGRGNVVNGYLVDVARSRFDRLRYTGPIDPLPRYEEDAAALLCDLVRDGQFPFRQRARPYQEVYIDHAWVPGERDVVARALTLGFAPERGESVVDLGCCTGGMLQYAALRGAGPLVGVDSQREYVDLAGRLARRVRQQVCYRRADLTQRKHEQGEVLSWLRAAFPGGPDNLIVASMAKHLGEDLMWWWVDSVGARVTYLESNACTEEQWPLRAGAEARGGACVGSTRDRNLRRCYKIERQSGPLAFQGRPAAC